MSAQLVPDHPAPRPRRRPGVPPGDADPVDHTAWDRPGRGVVWASAVSAGAGASVRILEPPLPYAAFARRIERYHAPYHRALQILLERRRKRFGYAVLLDAHSMPSSVGLDLVLGTLDGESAAEPLAAAAVEALRGSSALLSVKRDHPYRGGELVRRFGRPGEGLHAFQLEVSRRLYMDEQTYSLRPSSSDNLSDSVGKHSPARRRARELAELEARVRSLVRRLAEVGEVRHENAVTHARGGHFFRRTGIALRSLTTLADPCRMKNPKDTLPTPSAVSHGGSASDSGGKDTRP